MTHWRRPWSCERLKAGEGDDGEWDGCIASLTQWTWVWVSSRSWWWTGRPGVHPWGRKELDTTERLNWRLSMKKNRLSGRYCTPWSSSMNPKEEVLCYRNHVGPPLFIAIIPVTITLWKKLLYSWTVNTRFHIMNAISAFRDWTLLLSIKL